MKFDCCSPRLIKVTDYSNPRGYSYMRVPCGKCWFCLVKRQKEWVVRLSCENLISEAGYFVTLTYNDENLEPLNKKAIQRFLNSLRKWLKRSNIDVKLTYYAVGEYGRESNRQHYHLMIFGLPYKPLQDVLALMERFWTKGFVYVKRCNRDNVHYITKYLSKIDPRRHDVPPFVLSAYAQHLECVIGMMKELNVCESMKNLPFGCLMDILLLYLVVGRLNFAVNLSVKNGRPMLEIKILGYLVGPSST